LCDRHLFFILFELEKITQAISDCKLKNRTYITDFYLKGKAMRCLNPIIIFICLLLSACTYSGGDIKNEHSSIQLKREKEASDKIERLVKASLLKKIEQLIKRLKKLRANYTGTSGFPHFAKKTRSFLKNKELKWIAGVLGNLDIAVKQGKISDKLRNLLDKNSSFSYDFEKVFISSTATNAILFQESETPMEE
jgi:hypothetical protein